MVNFIIIIPYKYCDIQGHLFHKKFIDFDKFKSPLQRI